MRYVYCLLMALMILFMAVQYNDPDGLIWVAIYAVPAVWCAIAACFRTIFGQIVTRRSLHVCVFLSLAGVIWFWPVTPGFWRSSIWYETESAREGMGMMIVALVMLIVWFSNRGTATSSMEKEVSNS